MVDWSKVQAAYEAIKAGVAKRVDVDDKVSVYAVGTNVIRIDVKQ